MINSKIILNQRIEAQKNIKLSLLQQFLSMKKKYNGKIDYKTLRNVREVSL